LNDRDAWIATFTQKLLLLTKQLVEDGSATYCTVGKSREGLSMLTGRGELIGQFVMLTLFVIWLIAGAWAQKASAQVPQPAPQQQMQATSAPPPPCISPLIWPGAAPILGAIVAGFAAWLIAHYYTKRLKRIESTLEFSKRFHELIQQQLALNRKQAEDKREEKSLPAIEEKEAYAWWWQFFDLLLYEFDFWRRGLVRDQRFMEWIVWRWHDAYPKQGSEWTTCGVSYMQGWKRWRDHPAHSSDLIKLIDQIHAISGNTDTKDVEGKVRILVHQYNPRWRKY
jgi:hypothetical protein